jgi:nicotinamidase/pyrazinamidase
MMQKSSSIFPWETRLKIDLLLIDPQKDFIDTPGFRMDPATGKPILGKDNKPIPLMGSLPVIGSYQDMQRMATFIRRAGPKLNDIHVTMDCHRLMDVAHPAWWRAVDATKAGGMDMRTMPTPGTQISESDIGTKWSPVIPQVYGRNAVEYFKEYVSTLEKTGKYKHTIWPPHCLIGTSGNNIQDDVAAALVEWEEQNIAVVDYVTKGSNPYTEHFGAVEAEVPDPHDPSTMLNKNLVDTLEKTDMVFLGGEALSHCLRSTVEQIASNFSSDSIKKLCLLIDCSSPVIIPGVIDFTADAQKFVAEMQKRGMKVAKSTDVLQ